MAVRNSQLSVEVVELAAANVRDSQIAVEVVFGTTISGSFTANAVLAGPGGSFDVDAVIYRSQAGSLTADAAMSSEQSGSLTAEALIETIELSALTSDAVVAAVQADSLTADAALLRQQLDELSADAFVHGSFTADARISGPTAGSLAADAVIEVSWGGWTDSFGNPLAGALTADALLRVGVSGTITADARVNAIRAGSFAASAVIWSTQLGSFTADARVVLESGSFLTADAVIYRSQAGSLTADARIDAPGERTGSLTADATKHLIGTGSRTASATIKGEQGWAFDGAAVVRSVRMASLSASAYIRPDYETITANADISIGDRSFGSFTANARTYRIGLKVRVDGLDITDDVLIAGSSFTMRTGPNPGDFSIRVKDPEKAYDFKAGQSIEADFDGFPIFDGYIFRASKAYGFPVVDTTDPGEVVLIWNLQGVDINILFRRRFVFEQDDPTKRLSLVLPPGTSDLVYLREIMERLTLGSDDITTAFEAVASPNPDVAGLALSAGDSWETVMTAMSRATGAIWGLRSSPGDRFSSAFAPGAFAGGGSPRHRIFYYEDNDTPNAPFSISDTPGPGSVGYSNFEWLEDASKMVNDAQILGAGRETEFLTYRRLQDAASIAEHGRWEAGNIIRYDLYKPASVERVLRSIIYGSPANLHGAKDPSIVVKCRVVTPGLMAGLKVRIISSTYDEDIVLPIRSLKTTFVDRYQALFDIEATWDIDDPHDFSEWPPTPGPEELPPEDETEEPSPCTDMGLWWIDGGGWHIARSDPRLGSVLEGGFRNKIRYYQYGGLWWWGDGVDTSELYAHISKELPGSTSSNPGSLPPIGFRMSFSVPNYNSTPNIHWLPFPTYPFGPPGVPNPDPNGTCWGCQSNVRTPTFALDVLFLTANQVMAGEVPVNHSGTTGARLLVCRDGQTFVRGRLGPVAPLSTFTYERMPDGSQRIWEPNAETRPENSNTSLSDSNWNWGGTSTALAFKKVYIADPTPFPRVVLVYQFYGDISEESTSVMIDDPGDPSYGLTGMERFLDTSWTHDRGVALFSNSLYSYFRPMGGYAGVPPEGVPSELLDGYSFTLPVENPTFISVPSSFSPLPDCTPEAPLLTDRRTGMLMRDTDYIWGLNVDSPSWWPDSTRVSVDGVGQRLGIDYIELNDRQIQFTSILPADAVVYITYEAVV